MKIKKVSGLLCYSVIALLLSSATHAAESLRIGIEAAYPPFASKTSTGEIVGFDYDIGNALCAKMQVKCLWVEQEFDGLIPALRVRKVDAIISSLTISEERKKSVDFTHRYYQAAGRLVMREGADLGTHFSGLAGKRLGVQRAGTHDRFATEVLAPVGAQVVRYTSLNEAYLDLIAGRLAAVQGDDVALQMGFLDTSNGKGYAFAGEPLRDPKYFGEGMGIAVRKGDKALADRFNEALATLRENGKYKEIQDQYFDFDIYGD
ncbi:Lysine/arginine/ornithine-binding periplasmic protein [Pseudomonas reidholzensis]|uniref:Lysine/arginine/ornithine-binding periplasmic protein n=1 Tax=Pseudomonas reidholzensis TaxID=1785162 RepID=A0A383RWL7_9PSED|nr:ABC transporter substrate-binding protein [Pseudomonas reidholzensis]SYX90876.1 Lysine/arginine/ornithine-binding periplasmic protein [Pseudomonas reidholzensis]